MRLSMTTFASIAIPILMVGASCPQRNVGKARHGVGKPVAHVYKGKSADCRWW
jgi:hypothetical protein